MKSTMASDGPRDGRCGAKRRDGGYCERFPAVDDETGEPINGRCKLHGGSTEVGAPEGSANALDHGATASRATLEKHLDDEDLQWVSDLADSYRQLAGYSEDDPRCDLIRQACLASWQSWQARSEAIANELTSQTTIGVTDDGRPIVKTEEHYLAGQADRVLSEVRRTLKDAGVLGNDDGQVSAKSAAQIIAAAVEDSKDDRETIDVPNETEDGDEDE